jgi:hypothetical protein
MKWRITEKQANKPFHADIASESLQSEELNKVLMNTVS